MIKDIVDAIVALVTSGGSVAATAQRVGPAQPVDAPDAEARPSQEATFASRLQSITEDSGLQSDPLVAGSLELVGLDDVRQAMGDRWQVVGDLAKGIAEAELQLQLDDTDFYRPYSDTSFLVCFSELDKLAADRKARQIGARIKARLAQQIPEIAQAITVDHFVAAVDRTALRQGDVPIADRLFGTLERMREEAQVIASQFRVSLLRDFQILFSPGWHTTNHVVSINRCLLDMASGCSTLAQFQTLADPLQLNQTLAELDFLLLTKSLEALHRMLRSKRRNCFMVPVTFKTVSNPGSLQEYTRLLALMPDAYREFVLLEVCGIPESAQDHGFGRTVSHLSPFTKGLVLEVAAEDPRIGAFLAHNPWALSVSLAGASSVDPNVVTKLRRFTSGVAGTSTQTFAHGANSIGLALAALEAGFTYVDGPAIHPTVREPKPMSPLNPLPALSPSVKFAKRW